jgi:hypothetical protein
MFGERTLDQIRPKVPSMSHPTDDVSFLDGGPFFRLQRIFHARNPNVRVIECAIAFTVLTWFTTLILAALSGRHIVQGFFHDPSTHARLLLAGPVAILAELILDPTLRHAAGYFVSSGLVPDERRARFDTNLAGVARLRDSAMLEIILVFLAYVFSLRIQRSADAGIDWLQTRSAAGFWYLWVSRPLLNFLLLRWLWRVAIWTAFLFSTSKLSLLLTAAHPDRAGGLGFLGEAHGRFGIVVAAFSIVWCAGWHDRFLHGAVTADSLKASFAIFAVVAILVFLGPLVIFSPLLFQLRARAMMSYGRLAVTYAHRFENRWIGHDGPEDDALLGSADIQSLADMQNSVGAVHDVRFLPLDTRILVMFALGIVLPALALLPLVMPVEELVRRALKPLL